MTKNKNKTKMPSVIRCEIHCAQRQEISRGRRACVKNVRRGGTPPLDAWGESIPLCKSSRFFSVSQGGVQVSSISSGNITKGARNPSVILTISLFRSRKRKKTRPPKMNMYSLVPEEKKTRSYACVYSAPSLHDESVGGGRNKSELALGAARAANRPSLKALCCGWCRGAETVAEVRRAGM